MGMSMRSCEMDVCAGGGYRLVFSNGMEFFGKYIEVTPHSRLVWTNYEGGDAAGDARTLSLEGSPQCCRHRSGGWDGRVVRAVG
jgi:uncharacterized protein YndB with AHSA1/START domain